MLTPWKRAVIPTDLDPFVEVIPAHVDPPGV